MFNTIRTTLSLFKAPHTAARFVPGPQEVASRLISTTSILNAEPPRKKKRVDPAVLKVRVERKIGKKKREISTLEAEPKQPAPILEYQLTNSDIRDLKARPKHKMDDFGLTKEELRGARRLWTFYRSQQCMMERKCLAKVQSAQKKALTLLESIDKDLYDDTVTVDDTILIPYRSSHMRKETGPNTNYKPPDGYIKDISKEWLM